MSLLLGLKVPPQVPGTGTAKPSWLRRATVDTTYSPTIVACSKAGACTAGGLYYNYSVAGFFGVWAPSESGAPNAEYSRSPIRVETLWKVSRTAN